jgi:hypothetical protein
MTERKPVMWTGSGRDLDKPDLSHLRSPSGAGAAQNADDYEQLANTTIQHDRGGTPLEDVDDDQRPRPSENPPDQRGGTGPPRTRGLFLDTPPVVGEENSSRVFGAPKKESGVRRRGPIVHRCARCRQILPVTEFAPNPRMKSGVHSWCRPCAAERNREWRAANAGYVEAANAARREGPFSKVCADCGEQFDASRRAQVRCPGCQVEMRRGRKR